MNNQENNKEDILRQFINPDYIEQAPEGFTSKVMTRVRLEKLPLTNVKRSWKKNPVPAVSFVVTISLIGAAYLVSGNNSDLISLLATDLFKNIRSSLPELNLSFISQFSLPSIMIYTLVGILALTLFDRALYLIFHREK